MFSVFRLPAIGVAKRCESIFGFSGSLKTQFVFAAVVIQRIDFRAAVLTQFALVERAFVGFFANGHVRSAFRQIETGNAFGAGGIAVIDLGREVGKPVLHVCLPQHVRPICIGHFCHAPRYGGFGENQRTDFISAFAHQHHIFNQFIARNQNA